MSSPQEAASLPKISVVMAAYNEARDIGRAIESIVSQSFSDWELVIVDDGSTDATADIVRRYADNDSRIRLVCNDVNLRLSASLNKGIELARADLIARADADDINLPERLSKQYEFMCANPQVDVLGTAAYLLDAAGQRVRPVALPDTHEALENLPFLKIQFFHPSLLIRRRFFEMAGLYDARFPNAEDKELWLRGLEAGCRYANLSDPLIEYSTGGYVRSWSAIFRNAGSLFRIARHHRVKRGYVGAFLLFAYGSAIKLGIVQPKSLHRDSPADD